MSLAPLPILTSPAVRRRAGRRQLEAVLAALTKSGRPWLMLHADTPALVREHVAAIAAAGPSGEPADASLRVLLIGGDGLVHHAVQAAAGTDVVLGVVPIGTGNDFARALALPTDIDDAVVAALGEPRRVDVLRLRPLDGEHDRGDVVASVATLGFSAAVTERANRLRRPRGGQRYTVATLLELPRLHAVPLMIELDGEPPVSIDTTLLAVANTAYFGGGMHIAPSADPTDGHLDVCVIGAVGRFELLRVFPRVFKGRHLDHRAVSIHGASRAVLRGPSGERVAVWGDGEPIGELPMAITVERGALRVAGATV